MIKSLQLQEDAKTRLGRRCVLYSVVSERVSLYATLSQRKTPNGGEAEGTGAVEG